MTTTIPQILTLPMQVCRQCGHIESTESTVCSACLGDVFDRTEVAALGKLASWTTIRRAPTRFRDEAPYEVCIVDLHSGQRITGRLALTGTPQIGLLVGATEIRQGTPIFTTRVEQGAN